MERIVSDNLRELDAEWVTIMADVRSRGHSIEEVGRALRLLREKNAMTDLKTLSFEKRKK
ncbi:hypothetical protein [Paenibacillus sp. HB172176]|uniref:hypothetical protein n=1 Tax=Paenibacillus sp. HB172176 TaxID=2493690 RepID=UPI00143BB754|nr:hypothetical protein [Paenibacillus sp. HB172176]